MRVSAGVPSGRKITLYSPELFNEYEEVIIYPRRDFKRNFMAIKDQLNYSFLKSWCFEEEEEWRILGYWLSILERVHMMEIDMNQFFSAKASQSYLDTYLYSEVTDGITGILTDRITSKITDEITDSEVSKAVNTVSNPLEIDWL